MIAGPRDRRPWAQRAEDERRLDVHELAARLADRLAPRPRRIAGCVSTCDAGRRVLGAPACPPVKGGKIPTLARPDLGGAIARYPSPIERYASRGWSAIALR
ncbi:hypothetical protein [Polyangium jinanense]|uniref:Uncharacterized protein n=1 Tax=Polyangium jinanense TaxID=2829994 RepID=A0A9X4AY01_9BACT|nr:hypothetical protein [Polyangium jinanense]MDC3989014.1 hypothetical protein [Polyangium jinanense]